MHLVLSTRELTVSTDRLAARRVEYFIVRKAGAWRWWKSGEDESDDESDDDDVFDDVFDDIVVQSSSV